MAEIRYAVCGRLPLCMPDGNNQLGELYVLYEYGERGAVILSQHGEKSESHILGADAAYAAEARGKIARLIAENPDCPAKTGLFLNQILMQDNTACYAPYDALFEILNDVFLQAVRSEYHEPGLAGAVACPEIIQQQLAAFAAQNPLPSLAEQQMAYAGTRAAAQASPQLYADGTWDCACGAKGLTTKFCINCGQKRP